MGCHRQESNSDSLMAQEGKKPQSKCKAKPNLATAVNQDLIDADKHDGSYRNNCLRRQRLGMFWLYSKNTTAEYWNSDAAQHHSRFSALSCGADSSSTVSQAEHCWRVSAAKLWNPQAQDDISGVSCRAADSTLQKHFWIVKTPAQSWSPVPEENLETLTALITTDYQYSHDI